MLRRYLCIAFLMGVTSVQPVIRNFQPTATQHKKVNVTKATALKVRDPSLPTGLKTDTGGSSTWTLSVRFADHDSVDAVRSAMEVSKSSSQVQGVMVGAYMLALSMMVVIVTVMFYPLGAVVIAQVVIYICALAFVKIAMKLVFGYGYDYPKFVTAFHLLMSSLAGFSILLYRQRVHGKSIAVPSSSELLFGIIPIALTFGLSIGSENTALVFTSAAFSEIVAASAPVVSVAITYLCGLPFHAKLMYPIGVVVLGCCISITGELYFSPLGCSLLVFAVCLRSLKAVMQQKLMTGETKDKFDPVTLMAWTCALSFVELAIYSGATEGMEPVYALMGPSSSMGMYLSIIFSAAMAVTLNCSALFVIKQLGAVGMQIVSQLKSLLVVIGGVVLLSESFTVMQQLGFATVLMGVYWYSGMKRAMDSAEAESRQQLPPKAP